MGHEWILSWQVLLFNAYPEEHDEHVVELEHPSQFDMLHVNGEHVPEVVFIWYPFTHSEQKLLWLQEKQLVTLQKNVGIGIHEWAMFVMYPSLQTWHIFG